MDVMIWYNLVCSNLCGVLKLICDVGFDLVVIDYLGNLLDIVMLCQVLVEFWLYVQELVCSKEVLFVELGLDGVDDVMLLVVMSEYFCLINCFVVCMIKGMWLCCLLEIVLEIL